MSTLRGESIHIEGLRELQSTLKGMDKALPRELRRANKSIADDVTRDARSKASGLDKGGKRLERAIFAVAQQRSAGVQIRDGGHTEGALGYEFGSGRDIQRSRSSGAYVGFRQFDTWRGSGSSAGYAVYPTIREAAPDMPEKYARALDPLLRKAFPD